jgi:hypothetical protein
MVTRSKPAELPPDPDDVEAFLAWKKKFPDPIQGRLPPTRAAGSTEEGLVWLERVKPGKVAWLWPGRIPAGNLTMFDGDPGVGKSTIAIDLAARISAGRKWPDGQRCRPGKAGLRRVPDLAGDVGHVVNGVDSRGL